MQNNVVIAVSFHPRAKVSERSGGRKQQIMFQTVLYASAVIAYYNIYP